MHVYFVFKLSYCWIFQIDVRALCGILSHELLKLLSFFREKMESTSQAIEECERRWLEIEYLMGFKITNSTGVGARVIPGGPVAAIAGMIIFCLAQKGITIVVFQAIHDRISSLLVPWMWTTL